MDVSYSEIGHLRLAQDNLRSHRTSAIVWAFVAVNSGVFVYRALDAWYITALLVIAVCKTAYHAVRMLLAHRQFKRLEPRAETFRQYWNEVGAGKRPLPETSP